MNLSELAKGVRSHFTWEKDRYWHTSQDIEGDVTSGLAMFVGVSKYHGFDEPKVLEFLCITRSQYQNYLRLFRSRLREYQQLESTGMTIFEPSRRFYNKLTMIQNYVAINYGAKGYLGLVDFEF